MFASTKRSGVRSTMSSSRAVQKPRKDESFFAYIFRKVREMFMGLWGYSRKFLWVATTGTCAIILGLIVFILPFAFAYFL